jgi:hypothetical protein
MSNNSHPEKDSPPAKLPAVPATRTGASPFISFRDLEEQRQREWLFRRYRQRRPAWKRD